MDKKQIEEGMKEETVTRKVAVEKQVPFEELRRKHQEWLKKQK